MFKKGNKYRHNFVMLIDDSELDNYINVRTIKFTYFSKEIYVNTGSTSAIEFLENLEKMPDAKNVFPKYIFIDLNMPVIDGFQFINSFKQMKSKLAKKCKLVILTSSVYEDDKRKAKSISKDIVFLSKPLTAQMLSAL